MAFLSFLPITENRPVLSKLAMKQHPLPHTPGNPDAPTSARYTDVDDGQGEVQKKKTPTTRTS